nr:hypothetical protein BOSE7B_41132 [Bosea sp. 7B]
MAEDGVQSAAPQPALQPEARSCRQLALEPWLQQVDAGHAAWPLGLDSSGAVRDEASTHRDDLR